MSYLSKSDMREKLDRLTELSHHYELGKRWGIEEGKRIALEGMVEKWAVRDKRWPRWHECSQDGANAVRILVPEQGE